MSFNIQNEGILSIQFASFISGLFVTFQCLNLKSDSRTNPRNLQIINKILALGIFLVTTHLTEAYLSYYFLQKNFETFPEFVKKFTVFWKNYYTVTFSAFCISIISECRKHIKNKTSKRILGIANMNPIHCILLPLPITTPIFTIPVIYNFALGKYTMRMNYNKQLLASFIVNDFWVMLASLFGSYAIVLISTDSFKSRNGNHISVSLKEKPESVLSKSELEFEGSTDCDSESESNNNSYLYTRKKILKKSDVFIIALCWMIVLMFTFTLPTLFKWSMAFGFKGFAPIIFNSFIPFMSEMKGILCLYALLCVPSY
ncbi:hypothetical protein BB559_003889 [Furculomyces boomerangus]|uniref:Uncharacterized protein n=2 Tax=Harpellales TaxID=61421 RepID=A0A2T9YI73_9FUNG|nr:hypothetical protein BB559_003889 [Furculomyces boomerangus]PVZ97246.1 hypothetical protein BB558_006796 [Smittium angustum]PVZ97481.1 hypothetical protein BB558_006529 [Smittium angustum]